MLTYDDTKRLSSFPALSLCTLSLFWRLSALCCGFLFLQSCKAEEGSKAKISSPLAKTAKTQGKSATRPLVVCTTTMICDATRILGGKHFQIVGIIPPGQDPHIYTPRPQDGIFFRRAALILVNGLQLEGKMLDMIEGVGKKSLKLAEDPAITPRKTQGSADPHVWWSALYFARYAEKIRDALSSLHPTEKQKIHARAARYTEDLRKIHAWAKASFAQIPREKRLMITSHDAFYYFGQAYDIEVDAVLGISTEAQARAIEPLRLASLAVKRGIPAIFHENSVSQAQNDLVDSIQRLAKQKYKHDIKIAGPLYSDSLAEPSKPTGSYIGAFRANVEMIAQALGTKPLPWPLAP